MKQDLVVLSQREVFVVFDLGGNGDDSAGDRGNLGRVGQGDAPLGVSLGVVLANQHAGPDRLDVFEDFLTGLGHEATLLGPWICGKAEKVGNSRSEWPTFT